MASHINEFAFRLKEGSCEVDIIGRITGQLRNADGKWLTYADLTK